MNQLVGQCHIHVVTGERLREEFPQHKSFPGQFLVVCIPDQLDRFTLWFDNTDVVSAFVAEMQPRALVAYGTGKSNVRILPRSWWRKIASRVLTRMIAILKKEEEHWNG